VTGVQRLFDKGYTFPDPQTLPVTNRLPRLFRGVRPSHRIALAAGSLAFVLLAATPLFGTAAATPSPSTLPWTQYDTGRVNVVFPSQLPVVELVQDANASVSATLQLTGVYEVSSAGFPHPTVIAAAFPTIANAFNGSPSPAAPNSPTTLSATLTVFPVGIPIWNSTHILAPIGVPKGSTSLSLSYGATTSTAAVAGVRINWSVANWPWTNAGDLLALGFSFQYASGAALTACTGSSLFYQGPPPCTGQTVAPGAPVWSSHFSSLEGENGTGPVAVVSWATDDVVGTSMAPVTAGAYTTGPGGGELLLAAPSDSGSSIQGSLAFALVAPGVASLSTVLHGELYAYVGALGLITAGAIAGIVAYRRRDRQIRESL
jgi:hypothetical protein